MVFKKKKYKHNLDDLYKACSVDKKTIHKKLKNVNKYINKILNSKDEQVYKSKLIEYIENEFTKRELAIVMFLYNTEIAELKKPKRSAYSPEVA
jgi:hypothetical protein